MSTQTYILLEKEKRVAELEERKNKLFSDSEDKENVCTLLSILNKRLMK